MTRPLTQEDLERLFPFRPLPAFVGADAVYRSTSSVLLPPRRIKVSEAASRSMMISRPDYQGPYRLDKAPYMIEPMDCVRDRRYEAVVFVGPAQSSKTASLVEGSFVHAVTCDPLDMMIVQMTQSAARDFSQNRLDPLIRRSPDVLDKLSPLKSEDNIYDKQFAGMLLRLAWPAPTELSSKPVPIVIFTDYDRMPSDIGGEGSPFELGKARTRTFGSLGKVIAESSPKATFEGRWSPDGHRAPPVEHGILSLYNRGDMRRLYWACLDCGEYFEAHFRYLDWPRNPDGTPTGGPDAASKSVVMICPHCGAVHPETRRRSLASGQIWLRHGETIDADGVRGGEPLESAIASFWMFGPAACDQSWSGLVRMYLHAHAQFDRTGDDSELKAAINLHIGDCHVVTSAEDEDALDSEAIRVRAESEWRLGTVPEGVRAIVVSVDVQGHYFDVQATGYGPSMEAWIIDRWQISQHPTQSRMLDPGAYGEDWALLTPILDREWPLAHDPTRAMKALTMVVDSGGAPGVTGNAYAWDIACRRAGVSEQRLLLVKGDVKVGPKRVAFSKIDFTSQGRMLARGRKILMVGTDDLKDDVAAALRRALPGPGYVHTPHDLPPDWYAQATAETRDKSGRWKNERKARNEAFDHLVYSRAAILRPPFRQDAVNWDAPPAWWQPQDKNPLVRMGDGRIPGGSDHPAAVPSAPAGQSDRHAIPNFGGSAPKFRLPRR